MKSITFLFMYQKKPPNNVQFAQPIIIETMKGHLNSIKKAYSSKKNQSQRRKEQKYKE